LLTGAGGTLRAAGRDRILRISGRSIVVRRLVSTALAVVVMLGAAAAAQAQTLERVRASGTFKIGYRVDAEPFAYKNTLGEPAGYSVDLCRAVAASVKAKLGLAEIKLDYVPVDTKDRFQAVQDGRIDILCGATTETLARRQLVDFSLFTFIDGAGVMLRKDGPKDFEGLAGQKVGVRGATTTETALRDSLKQLSINAEVVVVDNHNDGLKKLEANEIQAYFADRGILMFLLIGSGFKDLWVSERQFTFEPYALALTRGDDDFRLLVDTTLSELYRSGSISQIFTNAFGSNAKESTILKALYVINALPE
jgi:ABC-type amino acid transport substrate-binding protein